GFSFDATILFGGGIGLVVLVLAFVAVPAWRAARPRGDLSGSEGSSSTSATTNRLARVGISPAAATGIQMALQPGKGRSATPVRVTVFGTALCIVALATAFTFGSSFQHLFDTPRLYGYSNWDLVAGNPHLDQDSADRVLAMLRADPAITDIGAADILEIVQLGPRSHPQQVSVFAYEAVKGTLGPTILDGR